MIAASAAVARGALGPDLEWLPVASLGLIAITRERRIGTRPVELEAYWSNGVRSIRIGGKRDMRPAELAELFIRLEPHLNNLVVKLRPGPWAVSMRPTESGRCTFALRTIGSAAYGQPVEIGIRLGDRPLSSSLTRAPGSRARGRGPTGRSAAAGPDAPPGSSRRAARAGCRTGRRPRARSSPSPSSSA